MRGILPRCGKLGSDDCLHTLNNTQGQPFHNQVPSSLPDISYTYTITLGLSSTSFTCAASTNDSNPQIRPLVLLKSCLKLHFGAITVRTLRQNKQQASLTKILGSHIDVYLVSETHI